MEAVECFFVGIKHACYMRVFHEYRKQILHGNVFTYVM